MMKRRTFLACGLAWAAGVNGASGTAADEPLRIGLTPVLLDDQVAFLERWRAYLEARLSRPIEFVQRGAYREIVDLLRQDRLDIGWVSGYSYVRGRQFLRVLAVPEYNGGQANCSYLIVPVADKTTQSILDLRGKVFAFSDPDSESGYLYPNYRLIMLKQRPYSFFSKTFFTVAHRKVVDAVAFGVAQGGAANGYVWDMLARFHPKLTAMTRVVERSPEFGFSPLVARTSLPREIFVDIRRVLMQMGDHAEGRELLALLNLDVFSAGYDRLYDSVEHMSKVVEDYNRAPAA
jgi:phosphonate transport system substrate-binding protein